MSAQGRKALPLDEKTLARLALAKGGHVPPPYIQGRRIRVSRRGVNARERGDMLEPIGLGVLGRGECSRPVAGSVMSATIARRWTYLSTAVQHHCPGYRHTRQRAVVYLLAAAHSSA